MRGKFFNFRLHVTYLPLNRILFCNNVKVSQYPNLNLVFICWNSIFFISNYDRIVKQAVSLQEIDFV